MTVKREEKETERGSRTVAPAGEPVTVISPAEQQRREDERRREEREPTLRTPIPIHPAEL